MHHKESERSELRVRILYNVFTLRKYVCESIKRE